MTEEKAARRVHDRDDLVACVADLLLDTGLHEFSLRQAAAACGTTHKVLLYHFGSADALLTAAVDLVRERTTRAGRDIMELDTGDGPNLQRLPDLWAWWVADPGVRVTFQALGLATADPERYAELGRRGMNDVLEPVVEGLRLAAPGGDLGVRATLVVAVLRGLTLDQMITGDQERAAAALALAVEALTDFGDELALVQPD